MDVTVCRSQRWHYWQVGMKLALQIFGQPGCFKYVPMEAVLCAPATAGILTFQILCPPRAKEVKQSAPCVACL